MSNWNDLSMRERRDVMRLHIKNGVRDLDGIRNSYNEFAEGGDVKSPLQPKPQVVDYSFSPGKYSVTQQPIQPNIPIDIKSLPDLSQNIINSTSIGNTMTDAINKAPKQNYVSEKSVTVDVVDSIKNHNKNLPMDKAYDEIVGTKIDPTKFKGKATKEDIVGMQKKLLDAGYKLPKSTLPDGSLDGLWGKETNDNINDYNSKIKELPTSKYKSQVNPNLKFSSDKGFIGDCSETQCSEFTQKRFYEALGSDLPIDDVLKETGITGDSWRLAQNVVNKGGKMIANYQDVKGIRKNTLKSDGPQVGDLAVMSTGGGSDYQKRANESGDGNTHSGIIDRVDPDGSYWVRHNVHDVEVNPIKIAKGEKYKGKEYYTHVNPNGWMPGFGFSVRKVVRPNLTGITGAKERTDETFNPNNKIVLANSTLKDNPVVNTFISTISDPKLKKELMYENHLDENEINSIFKVVGGLLKQESNYGESYNIPLMGGDNKSDNKLMAFGKRTASAISKLNPSGDKVSHGNASIKIGQHFPDNYESVKTKYQLDNDNSDRTATILASIIVGKSYKKFKQRGYSPEDALYRAIISYNSGSNLHSKNSKTYKTTGKTNSQFADQYDKDYANKVLLASQNFELTDGKQEKATYADKLMTNEKLIENIKKIKSLKDEI